ncbi:MAG: hypothetical protein QOH60_603 [Mycobacterium sp.]|jgi:hypothetical protein|nr:hypothetical protein [Mycobacterium sp.]
MALIRTMFAALAAAFALAVASPAAADPVWPVAGGESAAETIRDLEDQGYTVQINWANGYSTVPLYLCQVNAIHNPDRSAESPPPEFTTVYVDVHCPDDYNHDWGHFGIGFGF